MSLMLFGEDYGVLLDSAARVRDQVAQIKGLRDVELSTESGRPEIQVHMDRAVREYPEFPYDFDATPTRWTVVTKSGVLGDATAATPEKGKAILNALVERCVAIAEREVHEACS